MVPALSSLLAMSLHRAAHSMASGFPQSQRERVCIQDRCHGLFQPNHRKDNASRFFFFFFTVLFVISKSNHPYRRELHDIGRQESPTGDLLAASCHIHDHRWLLASQKEPTRHHEPPGRNARPPDEVGLPKNQNSHPNLVKYLELTSS